MSRGLGKRTIALREAILDVLRKYAPKPMGGRQVAYQLVGRPWEAIENTEAEKERVGRTIVAMRRDGSIPYGRIKDRSRAKHHFVGWDGVEDVLTTFSTSLRLDMWRDQAVIPMIGCEKQALEGIISEIVDSYGVSLWTFRGFNSLSFDYEWSEEIKELTALGKRVEIAYLGDLDPSGLCAEETSHARLGDGRRLYGFSKKPIDGFGADFGWRRIGLLPEDFDRFDIAHVPVKPTDSRSKVFLSKFAQAAELDALQPDELESRIRGFIETYIDLDAWHRSKRDEKLQRESLRLVAANWQTAVAAARGAA